MELLFKEERRKIVFEVFDKYPDLPNLTTAKILFTKYPGFFPDVESARRYVRLYRGKSGKKDREKFIIKKYFR